MSVNSSCTVIGGIKFGSLIESAKLSIKFHVNFPLYSRARIIG